METGNNNIMQSVYTSTPLFPLAEIALPGEEPFGLYTPYATVSLKIPRIIGDLELLTDALMINSRIK